MITVVSFACSRLQDIGEKSFSKKVKKKCEKRAKAFPNRARLIFALLVPTILSESLAQATRSVTWLASSHASLSLVGRNTCTLKKECKDVLRVTKYERDYWRGLGRNNHVFLSECAWLISVLVCTIPKRWSP